IDFRIGFGFSFKCNKSKQGEVGKDACFGENFVLGVNTQSKFSHTSPMKEKFYVNYWTIYPRNTINNTFNSFNNQHLSFKKRYNPEQVVYYDYAFIDNLSKQPVNEDKFNRDFNESENEDWSDEIKVTIPNLESLSGITSPAIIIKLIIAKLEQPDSLNLP